MAKHFKILNSHELLDEANKTEIKKERSWLAYG